MKISIPDKYKIFLNYSPVVVLLILSMLVFIFLIFRNMGLYPTVFGDEHLYTKFSRLVPLSEAAYPNYIFFSIYQLTSYCGEGFLECARILNALFFVAAMPFIYSISRLVAGRGISTFVTALAVLGPNNSYTGYFMPESLYFLVFWIFSWYLLRQETPNKSGIWLIAGFIWGFLALVKPQAIFLFPAVILYIIYVFSREKIFSVGKLALSVILVIASALATKYGISYILAGASGLTLLGTEYGSLVEYGSSRNYLQLLMVSLFSLQGHLMALSILYGLPLALMLTTVGQLAKSTPNDFLEKICVFSLLLLINLLCVTVLVTAAVAYSSPTELPSRLHIRYYSFMLPFLIITAAGFFKIKTVHLGYFRYVVGGLIGLFALYGLIMSFAPYLRSSIDCPEIFWSSGNNIKLWVLGGLLILPLFLWLAVGRIGVRLYLLFSLPIVICVSSFNMAMVQRDKLARDVGEEAGIFAAEFLPKEDLGKMVIAGSHPLLLHRARYQTDNPEVTIMFTGIGEHVNPDELPEDRAWLLLIGNQVFPEKYYQIQRRGFSLVSLKQDKVVDFKKSWWPGIISNASGLSYAESWGTCSDGDVVTLNFRTPLPGKFKVRLVAAALGHNVGKDFIAKSGETEIKFVLTDAIEEKNLYFDNARGDDTLKIIIPLPTAIRDYDKRKLGMALFELEILPL